MGKMKQVWCLTSAGASTNTKTPYNFHKAFYCFLIWNLVFCFLFLTVSSQEGHHYPFPTAHVELFSFDRGTLKIIQDKVNVPVTLSQPTRYFELYLFQCNGTYPVQWTYVGEGNPITTADAGRTFRDFYDIKTYSYQSILLIYKLDEFQSGRYICRGMLPEHEKISIFYDVFVPVDGKFVLLTNSEKTVYVPEEKETAYIPCGVSDSTAEVALYKGNPEAEGTFKRVEDNTAITFNPRKGFKIKMRQLKEPYGKYMCTAKSNSRRRKVNLYPLGFKMYNEPHNPYHEKFPVQFSYDYKYNRMLCCTGTSYVPRLQWAGCTSILDCQIKSVCFDEDRCEPRIGNAGYDPAKWIDPGPLPSGCAGWKLRDDPNGDMGMFKCTTPGITQYQPYLLNRGNIFLDFETAPPAESIMTLRKMSKGPVYVGRHVEFHCNGTRFYFGYGFRWAYQRGNGDIEFVEDSDVIRDRFFTTAHRRQTVFRIPHADIKAIVCFGPIVNHPTEWRTTSMPLQIEEEPIFVPLKPDSPHLYEDHEHHLLVPHRHENDHYHHQDEPRQQEPQPSPPPYYDISPYHDSSTHLHKEENSDSSLPELSYDPHLIDYSRTPGSFTNAQVLADKIKVHGKEVHHEPGVFNKQHDHDENYKTELKIHPLDQYKPDLENLQHSSYEIAHPETPTEAKIPDIIYDTDFKRDPSYPSGPSGSGGTTHELDIIRATQIHPEKDRDTHGNDLINQRPAIQLDENYGKLPVHQPVDLYKRDPVFPIKEPVFPIKDSDTVYPIKKPVVTNNNPYLGDGLNYYKIGVSQTPTELQERPREVHLNTGSGQSSSPNTFNTNQFPSFPNLYKREPTEYQNNDPYSIAKQNLQSINVNPLTTIYANSPAVVPIDQYSKSPSAPPQDHYSQSPSKISSEYTQIYKQFPSKVQYKEIPLNPSSELYGKDNTANTYTTLRAVSTTLEQYPKPKGPSSVDPFGSSSPNSNHYDHKFSPIKSNHHNHVKLYAAHPTKSTHYVKGVSSPVPYLNTDIFNQNGQESKQNTNNNNNNGAAPAVIKAHFSDYYNKLSPSPTVLHSSLIDKNHQYKGEESSITISSRESNAKKIDAVLKGHFPNYYPKLAPSNSPLVRTDNNNNNNNNNNNRKSVSSLPDSKPLVYSTLVKIPTTPETGKYNATPATFSTIKDTVPSYKQIKQTFHGGFSESVKRNDKSKSGSPITFDIDFIYPVNSNTQPHNSGGPSNINPSIVPAGSHGQLITQKIISGSSELFSQLQRQQEANKAIDTINPYALPSLF